MSMSENETILAGGKEGSASLVSAVKKHIARAVKFVTFSDMLIEKKFLVFTSGVGAWFIILASIGMVSASSPGSRWAIFFLTLAAICLLLFFGFWFARSLTKPLRTMIDQVNSLSEGEVDLKRKVTVNSADEMGTLSESMNRLLDAVHDMALFKKVIEEDDSPEDVYRRLGRTFISMGLERFRIYEVSNSKNVIRVMQANPDTSEDTCNREIMVNCNLCRAKKTGDVVMSSTYPNICKHFLRGETMGHVCVPMIIGDSTGGVVQFMYPAETAPGEIARIGKKISRAGKYIQEALPVLEAKRLMNTLRESSFRDHLTGLYNRRFLEEYTETLTATVFRRKSILGLMMCDLDFFKEVNDTYGHQVGDKVIQETCRLISSSVRASDMVIRYGGEEFLVLLQDLEEDEAVFIAEKIRSKLEETKMKMPGGFIQKTISIGISEFPKDTANFWQAIKYADIALYKAKDTGRNRVQRFAPEMWTSEAY